MELSHQSVPKSELERLEQIDPDVDEADPWVVQVVGRWFRWGRLGLFIEIGPVWLGFLMFFLVNKMRMEKMSLIFRYKIIFVKEGQPKILCLSHVFFNVFTNIYIYNSLIVDIFP